MTQFEEELKAEEQKHKKIIKYDLETFIALFIIVAFVVTANLVLKSDYKDIGKLKTEVSPALNECNKGILNVSETFHKNSTDDQARTSVDSVKTLFDGSIVYYGQMVKKGTDVALIIHVIDSCYKSAVEFRNVLGTQKGLAENGVSGVTLDAMDNSIKNLKGKIDSLVTSVDAYNASGFFLKFSWVTPYPGPIEYTHVVLPEIQPLATNTPDTK
ncbi:MAG TPA: hypothetical protein VKI62_06085 [Bacteroidota bacterium]|nr:hypothetical protein [Bacteroidota bacterium]